jgi:uncharacterized protein with ParB-like and HNH nuclease domain
MNNIGIRSISSLSGLKFRIPEYQRGYRWREKQATQLLEDIREFYKRDRKAKGEFYCMQPIVVRPIADGEYEVVDGQQRLTTIFIILKAMEPMMKIFDPEFEPYSINYVTREGSETFLNELGGTNISKAEEYIDFHYMHEVYLTVLEWIKAQGKNLNRLKFIEALLSSDKATDNGVTIDNANNVRFIWYEIGEDESSTSIDIFTRLNIGKIPLTNSELIKALLLKRSNFPDTEASLKQIQIATEWNNIEIKLQDDSFWYFIYDIKNPLRYDNRIEYIFDLITRRSKDSEFYYTFNEFARKLEESNNDIDKIWKEVKDYFQTLDEWYSDRELYHYIGFLINEGDDINAIKEESEKTDKKTFKEKKLKKRIKAQFKDCVFNEVNYNSRFARKLLLFFNILTVVKTKKSDMRFPFNKFKKEKWDIEHVCSQTDKIPSQSEQQQWAKDILEYFTESTEPQEVQAYLDDLNEESADPNKVELLSQIMEIAKQGKIGEDDFKVIFESVEKCFGEEQIKDKDDLRNLTLLDAETNRSYGNSFFPIKRRYIIANDENGVFVPIVTKNLFLKYYSRKIDNMMHWTNSDADAYITAMYNKVKDYLPEQNDEE